MISFLPKWNEVAEDNTAISQQSLTDLTAEDFMETYVKQSLPMVLHGFSKHWSKFPKWNFDNFGSEKLFLSFSCTSWSLLFNSFHMEQSTDG